MNKQGFKVGRKVIVSKVKDIFSLQLLAEETNNGEGETQPQPSNAPQINYEDLIKKAREEEKAKLYPQIDKLKKEKDALVEKHNKAMLSIGQKDEEIKALKDDLASVVKEGGKVESQEVARLTKENENLVKEIETLKNSTVDRETIENEIRAEYDLKIYKLEKLHEVGDGIIPELVSGNTKEEIDESIKKSVERYNQIVGNVQQPQNVAPQQDTKIPTGNTNPNIFSAKSINPDDISKMTPKEWAEYRKKLNLK